MLNFALVGCGRIANRHAELLGTGQIAGASLVSVCDIIHDKAKALAEQFNIPAYQCMHEMMDKHNIDVVVVLTESGNHACNVIALAPYGAHIIVEKPMALTLYDADNMVRACEEHGVRLFVVKQNRFNLPVTKLREALERNRFGDLFLGTVRVRWCRPQSYYDQDAWRGTWALDGGVLTNQASHHIDLLAWMMGDVRSVYAKSVTASVDIEAEDTAVVLLKFANGALGVIEATTAIRPKDLEGSISIMGSTGSVEIGGFAVNEMKTWNFDTFDVSDADVISNFSVNPPNVYGFGHQAYYEHVLHVLESDRPALVDGIEGRKSLEVIHAIYESIETGDEIILPAESKFSQLGKPSS